MLPARRMRGEVEAVRLLLGGSLWVALGVFVHWLAGAVQRLLP
jgi:hypothetical protein